MLPSRTSRSLYLVNELLTESMSSNQQLKQRTGICSCKTRISQASIIIGIAVEIESFKTKLNLTVLTGKCLEVASLTLRNATKKIREQRVSAHLLIYPFLFSKLSLGFGLDFEFGLGLMLGLYLGLELGLGPELGLGLE